jgi:hypothetical protein
MRFMVLVKASKDTEAGVPPGKELVSAVRKLNDDMAKAGVLLAHGGLQPSSKGLRIRFNGAERLVMDGPFAETKELVAGFQLIQVSSKEEAVEWASRLPFKGGEEVEVRPLFEPTEFDRIVSPGQGEPG